jgi:hypothetical protein
LLQNGLMESVGSGSATKLTSGPQFSLCGRIVELCKNDARIELEAKELTKAEIGICKPLPASLPAVEDVIAFAI